MERSKPKVLRIVVAAVIFAFVATNPVQTLTCDNYSNKVCRIHGLQVWDTSKFPVQEYIELYEANVAFLSPEVMERMKWVSKLSITEGNVGKIYVKPDLQYLSATKSKTIELIIGSDQNDNLEELIIVSNLLETIPENIDKLSALSTLRLSENQIEVLDMNKFRGLKNLTSIDIASNKLYYLVPVEDLELPSLETIDLSNNYLTEVDFAGWIMPKLQTITLTSNYLSYLLNVDAETFPSLSNFEISGNSFNCRWLEQFAYELKKIYERKRKDHYSEYGYSYRYNYRDSCTKSTLLSPATYRRLNMTDIRSSGILLDNKDQLEQQINAMTETDQRQMNKLESLTASLAQQTQQLQEANEKLVQQQALIDELVGRVQSLQDQTEKLKALSLEDHAVVGRTVSKGLSEKLIREISAVVWRNLREEE